MEIMLLPAEPDATHTPRTSRSTRLTAWCVDHRWLVAILSTLTLAAGVAAMALVGITTAEQEDQLVGDSAAAQALQDGKDFGERPTEMIIATSPTGLDPAAATQLGTDIAGFYLDVDGVAEVGEPIPGADGRSVVLPVMLDGVDEVSDADLDAVEAATAEVRSAYPDLQVGQIGDATVDRQVDESLGRDFQRAEMISIPLTLLILLVAFGAVVAAGVPLVLGLGAVGVALGATALISSSILPVDRNAQSLVLLIGLAVGVDYALFVVRRCREERRKGASVRESILAAGDSAGRAVVISGVTVLVAMAGMLVAGGLFTSLALGTLLVVLVAVVASATTLPAILAILGDRIDALRLPFTRRREERAATTDGVWGRIAGAVTRRPLLIGGSVAAVMIALALPALSMRTALGGLEVFDQSLPMVQAQHQLEQALPADGTSVELVVSGPADEADHIEQVMRDAADRAARQVPDVSAVEAEVERSTDATVTTLDIGLDLSRSDERLHDVIAEVRDVVLPEVRAGLADVPGVEVHLGGGAAASDLAEWMDGRLPWVVGFVLLLTFVVMAVSFGSLALAASTVLLNGLSVAAAYGAMTLVFGDGPVGRWAEDLLGFTSTGAIASWLPLLMFVTLFGLSMDYHVFVTSRVREAFDAGASPPDAVRLGVARSAGVVTSAAAVMVAVFSIFATLTMLEMKQLGVGLAVAIALDATLVRGVLLPATFTLLGERAHRGPSWLPRVHH